MFPTWVYMYTQWGKLVWEGILRQFKKIFFHTLSLCLKIEQLLCGSGREKKNTAFQNLFSPISIISDHTQRHTLAHLNLCLTVEHIHLLLPLFSSLHLTHFLKIHLVIGSLATSIKSWQRKTASQWWATPIAGRKIYSLRNMSSASCFTVEWCLGQGARLPLTTHQQ